MCTPGGRGEAEAGPQGCPPVNSSRGDRKVHPRGPPADYSPRGQTKKGDRGVFWEASFEARNCPQLPLLTPLIYRLTRPMHANELG